MLRHRVWWKGTGIAVAAVGMALAGLAVSAPASAAAGQAAAVPHAGPVPPTPAVGTPELAPSGSTVQTVRQLVQCGNTMYAVGSFTQLKRYSTTYTRDNVFSFSATSPYKVTSWAPDVNGEVNSITFSGGNCANAYLGGDFTTVNGTAAKEIAEVSTSTGALNTTFRHSASGKVETLASYQTHILVGGYYKSINASSSNPYMTSLDATSGKDDGFIHLGISGNYQFCNGSSCTTDNPTRVYNQQLSHGGTLDLVEGDFTSAGGVARQQIFMLNLATTPATVTAWTSPEWDGSAGNLPSGYPYQCALNESFYIRAAAWSPDDNTVYISTTGFHPFNQPTGSSPRNGLCDAAAAFPATQGPVLHEWVNYTGCDSLYSVAADDGGAYFGGHERWSENPNGCDFAGPGAVADQGMEGLSPADGSLLLNSGGAPLYTRTRGKGADDMLVTSGGLWIASDNDASQGCNNVSTHAGICFLPYGS
jgi:hypothetical protein